MSGTHAETVTFVRDTMLPAAPPPDRQSGAVMWLRENLFSGPLNVLLTIGAAAIIFYVVQGAWPWLSHGVWNASSLPECRGIIQAAFGPDATGACWALIRERWSQFVFGFYPSQLYWRPVLAFGLLFVALAPVLFSEDRRIRRIVLGLTGVLTLVIMQALGAPLWPLAIAALIFLGAWIASEGRASRLLVATLLYPATAWWLLWGGTLWLPIMAMAGFVLGYLAFVLLSRFGSIISVLGAVLVTAAWWLWIGQEVVEALASIAPLRIMAVSSDSFGGFLLSITIGVTGIALSLPLGIILALARRSDLPLVKAFAVMFIEFIRGVPLIALLFVASLLLNYFLPPGTNFDIILRVIIMVTLFAAAYMAEVIRGGLASLPRGQYEAADALGLDYWKAQRLIILPQALKVSIPGIVSTFIGLFKDTTLVTFVGLFDPLKATADTVRASIEWKGTYWEPYIFTGAIFFILCFGMSRYSMYLERRLQRDNR